MNKWENFWQLVQKTSQLQGKCFFMNCGEGRELNTDTLDGEDLSGWLVPFDKVSAFEQSWSHETIGEEWNDFIFFALWKNKDGIIIEIEFKTF